MRRAQLRVQDDDDDDVDNSLWWISIARANSTRPASALLASGPQRHAGTPRCTGRSADVTRVAARPKRLLGGCFFYCRPLCPAALWWRVERCGYERCGGGKEDAPAVGSAGCRLSLSCFLEFFWDWIREEALMKFWSPDFYLGQFSRVFFRNQLMKSYLRRFLEKLHIYKVCEKLTII